MGVTSEWEAVDDQAESWASLRQYRIIILMRPGFPPLETMLSSRKKNVKFVLIGRNERSEWRSYLTFLRHSSTIVMRGSDVRLRLHVAVDVGSTVLKVRFQEVLGIFELE